MVPVSYTHLNRAETIYAEFRTLGARIDIRGDESSSQICAVMDEKIKKHFPDSLTVSIPVADGGEGSLDAFITAVGGVKEYVTVDVYKRQVRESL